jgi:hypothetical protein
MLKKHGNATHQDTDSQEYRTWIHIRRKGVCCPEWAASYETFLEAMGRRPPFSKLLRKNTAEPHGPVNSHWKEIGVKS